MSATQILKGLEGLDLTGAEADAAARMGFLEWVFADGRAVTPDMARDALSQPEARGAQSDAARAFVGFLQQARACLLSPRRRGRPARLN